MTDAAHDVDGVDLARYLAECRTMVPQGSRAARVLYDLMLDYPMRDAGVGLTSIGWAVDHGRIIGGRKVSSRRRVPRSVSSALRIFAGVSAPSPEPLIPTGYQSCRFEFGSVVIG